MIDLVTVTVFGLGFVGLTTSLGFAYNGCKVYGLDIDKKRKELLKSGSLPFSEPHMDVILNEQLNTNFFISDDVNSCIKDSDIIYYCVGTPYGKDGSADLTYLFNAIDSTIDAITDNQNNPIDNKYRVLVTKSTIPPSTTSDKIVPYVKSKGPISNFLGIANNPEFLREGHCWEDFINADRVVIGCEDEKSKELMKQLYSEESTPLFFVSYSTGEFIKYLSNTLLATLISYSNEMANVADHIGNVDVSSAFKILHMDRRWGGCLMTSYVYPGCGYGGYCLPKDTCALLEQSKIKGFEPKILREVINTNTDRPKIIANKIVQGLPHSSTIGILGLSFKPESDDVRDSPSLMIIKELNKLGFYNICAYDPIAINEFKLRYPDINIDYKKTTKEVWNNSDVLAIVTAWNEFKEVPSFGNKPIIDCRYML